MKYLILTLSLMMAMPNAAWAHYYKSYKSHKSHKSFHHKKTHGHKHHYKKYVSKKHHNKYKGKYCGKKGPKDPVVSDFEAEFYYLDNSAKMIYKGMINGSDVVLKKFMASPYSSAYLAQIDYNTLTVVEASGSKRIQAIDIESKASTVVGNFPFLGTITQAYASGDYVLVNQDGTNNIHYKNVEDGEFSLLGKVLLNGSPLKITGGDIYMSISSNLYMVTDGTMYGLETFLDSDEFLNATPIVSGLGNVTGLVEITNGLMLVSTMNSSTMKLVDVYTGEVKTLNIKGELQKTGTKGGDLAGFDSL